MTGRVLPLHASTHRVVDAMLPWYVNETLDGDERALVQRHLDECAQCREEVEWLRGLHAACAACADQEGASGALRGLRHKLARRPGAEDAPRRRSWHGLPPLWRAVALAQLALIAVLGTMLVTGQDPAPYRTLGSRDARAGGNVVVVFDAATTEARMRALLRSVDARVVDGPTQSNAYVLAIPSAMQARALDTLRAAPGVALAQPLDAPGAR